ncbi:exodeoxyribonuclease VII small subunit [Methylobrevis pamukkalensis]|uniref:Exodeoxyribonuclease 7 small subunit n=1 Tax=Methylobrevis pamukkalensis TaxID=1439726 RepID=A0A1E3H2J3_9HYPH|nr:exodeoxyribonuclease VII small subunit [Methylobrevis pamukkalensis]ODN69751.1 Exodeoxyribonuclease 7 small subunit [Methylobrevis pamukkalensis]
MTDHSDIKTLSFEAALKELEGIVSKLEQGSVPLEESISIYERGDALRAHCDRLLRAAEAKVEKIRLGQDGTAATEPLDVA